MRTKQGKVFQEELELDSLARSEEELVRRQRELDREARRIEMEKIESARTLPPSEEIRQRMENRRHEEMIMTRGEVANLRREQNRGLFMLVLLLAATASLVWWGIRLMQGG